MAGTIYFWQNYEVPYGWLGQWYACPFTVDGTLYASTEMYMMVQKARTFGDTATEAKMLATTDPSKHKALGRQVAGFDSREWDKHKERVVEEGNYAKFSLAEMKAKLLATGDKRLVEASPYDRIWGVGYSAEDAEENQANWGQNLLGKAIMRVRETLRAEGQTWDG